MKRFADEEAAAERQMAREGAQAARAQEQLDKSSNDTANSLRNTSQAVQNMDQSLWALRSAVGEIEGLLQGLQSTAISVSTAMWENFSAQEMAIAQISRVSQATVTELDGIVSSVRQMSREIPIAFDELGRIAMLGSQV